MSRGHDVHAVDLATGRTVWGPKHPFAAPADVMLSNGVVRAFVSEAGSPARIALWAFARDEWHYAGDVAIESAALGVSEDNFNTDVLERAEVLKLTTDEAVLELGIRGAGVATVTLRRGDRGIRVNHGSTLSNVVTRQRRVAFYPAEVDLPDALEPDDIDDLAAWYDADAISATVGGLVSTWPNSEGTAGRDLTSAGADRPTYLGHVSASVAAVGAVASAFSSASLVVTKPTGVVAGSLLLAFIDETTTLGTPGGPSSGPAGWTKINQENGSNNTASSLWMLVAGGSEPANYTWNWNTARLVSGYIIRVEGYDPADPIAGVGGTQNNVSPDPVVPTLTPGVDDCLVIIAAAKVSDDTYTPPAGYTERVDNSDQIGFSVTAASKIHADGSTGTGNIAFDASGSGAASYSVQVVAITPLGDQYDLGHEHAAVRFAGSHKMAGSAFLNGSKGSVLAVMRFTDLAAALTQAVLSSSDDATTTRYIQFSTALGDAFGIAQDNVETDDVVWSPFRVLGEDQWVMVGFHSNGGEYFLSLNGVRLPITLVSGPNNGDWFAETTSKNNVVMGARTRTTTDLYLYGDVSEAYVYDGRMVTEDEERGLFARAVERFGVDAAMYGSALELGRRHATTTDEGSTGVEWFDASGFMPVLATLSGELEAGPGLSLKATAESIEVFAYLAKQSVGETAAEQHGQYAAAREQELRI